MRIMDAFSCAAAINFSLISTLERIKNQKNIFDKNQCHSDRNPKKRGKKVKKYASRLFRLLLIQFHHALHEVGYIPCHPYDFTFHSSYNFVTLQQCKTR
jgi:hypothetical protein